MQETSENMVLRTVYLPRELDQKLKAASIRDGRSKGDIVRDMIRRGLSAFESTQEKGTKPTAVSVKPVVARKRRAGSTKRKVTKAPRRDAHAKA